MNVQDLTFGIEIECNLPHAILASQGIRIGSRHHGIQIPGLPRGWNAQEDGSVQAHGSNRAIEIVSGILQGDAGLAQVVAVVNQLKTWGATVNASCGFHVHVGFRGQSVRDLQKLIHIVANHEKALYATTGTKRREQEHWCKSVKADFRNVILHSCHSFGQLPAALGDRYHILNVSNLIMGGKPTVEFRAFAGTMNLTKMSAYIRLCLALVEKACNTTRAMPWDAKATVSTSPVARRGEGWTELTRLFYALGWTRGQTPHIFGHLAPAGCPDIEANKRILCKMARKYDGLNTYSAEIEG